MSVSAKYPIEALLTTALVPNEKNLFPGIRPRLVEDQIKLANNGAQDCAYCARENLDINACLLNRVFSCGSQGHPKFIIRYGRENFDGPASLSVGKN